MDTWILQMLSMAFTLFLLMDSIGNVPIFVSILKDIHPKRQKKIIFRELIIALAIILIFNLIGTTLLSFLHVTMPTIMISGGIILFLIAIKMIFPVKQDSEAGPSLHKEPFIVPLATPLVAGPAVLAAVMLYSGQHPASQWMTSAAVVVAWAVSTLVLLSSPFWKKILGESGMVACERLMGLILTLLAVQMFLEGVQMFSKSCRF